MPFANSRYQWTSCLCCSCRLLGTCAFSQSVLSLFLQFSAVEQVLDILVDILYILVDILSWEIAEVVSPCLPRSLWSHTIIRVFLLLGTVCLQHPSYPVLTSCPLSTAFPYPQPGDAGGRHSAPAVCQSLTSADPTISYPVFCFICKLLCCYGTACCSSDSIHFMYWFYSNAYYSNEHVCEFFCLLSYLENHMAEPHQIFWVLPLAKPPGMQASVFGACPKPG